MFVLKSLLYPVMPVLTLGLCMLIWRESLLQAIAEGDDTWRLFAPFELVWAGGRLGRAAMQVYYWWFSARERSDLQHSTGRC